MAHSHLDNCPSLASENPEDCSCKEEVGHYIYLAKWSFGLFLFEFIGGVISGSIALISDSIHVLLDGTESALSAVVSKISCTHEDEHKVRKIGGMISAFLLLVVACVIIYEGWERVVTPHKVEWYMPIIAFIGLSLNVWLLHFHKKARDEHKNQTHGWQTLHFISDIFTSCLVIIGGVIMFTFDNLYWVDGVLSIVIGLLIVYLTSSRIMGIESHSHKH